MIDLDSDEDLVKDLSRYNRGTDKVHLTDPFDIFLGWQGPLRCRFPWCKDVSVDRRFWEILVCLDPTKKGWIMDEHVELWVNYMWHFRPHDADWAMVGGYFVQLIPQDSIPSCGLTYDPEWREWYISLRECLEVFEVNGHSVTSYRMILSVPTPYSSRLLGFNMDEEPII
nr:phospholipase-like protein [Tanacetum cinerariifolium]